MKFIDDFRNEEHPYFDGKSSHRVIDAVVSFYDSGVYKKLKKKPINLVRKFKITKKIYCSR